MAQNNMTILTAAWISASTDFQQRVPAPDKAGFDATAKFLLEPLNGKYFNEFTSLMYQIGLSIIEQKAFKNPLKRFLKEPLYFGNTVREIAAPWIEAHSFNPCDETLLKCENPEYAEWFYSINREDVYPWTINAVELRKALAGGADGMQINNLIGAKTQAAINSDEYDTMNIMLNEVAFADKNWGAGLFKKHVAEPVDQATAQAFLAEVKSDFGRLKFPSELYNSINVPVFARPDELVLLVTPEVAAKTDVYSWFNRLVGLNLDADEGVVVEIPEFPINGVFAMLTTADFFQCRDSFYTIDTFFDPKAQKEQYFLHHQGSYAASPYVPCICYTTDEATAVPTVTVSVTGLEMSAKAEHKDGTTEAVTVSGSQGARTATVYREVLESDSRYIFEGAYTGTVTPSDTPVRIPMAGLVWEAVSLTKVGSGSTETVIPLNSRTYITEDGVLHVQAIEKYFTDPGDTVKAVFTCDGSYINPSGSTVSLEDKLTITIEEQ